MTVVGMSKPVTLSVADVLNDETMNSIMEMSYSEEELAGLEKAYAAAQTLASEDGMTNLINSFAASQNNLLLTIGSGMTMETKAYEFVYGEGEETASVITIKLDPAALNALVKEMAKIADSEPAILDMINGMLIYSGEEEITSLSALMTEDVFTEGGLIVTIASNEDASKMDIDVSVYDDVTAEAPEFVAGVVFAYNASENVNMLVAVVDEYGDKVYFEGTIADSVDFPGESEVSIYGESTFGGESEQLLSAWFGPDAELGTVGSILLMPQSESDAIGIAWSYSDTKATFNVYDTTSSYVVGLTNDFEGAADGEVKAYITINELDTIIDVTAIVSVDVTESDLDAITALAGTAGINAMTMTETETNAITQELSFVAMGALGVLAQNVPGIAPLLGY